MNQVQAIALEFISHHKKNHENDWMPRLADNREEILSRVFTNLMADVYGPLHRLGDGAYEIEISKHEAHSGVTEIFYFEVEPEQ